MFDLPHNRPSNALQPPFNRPQLPSTHNSTAPQPPQLPRYEYILPVWVFDPKVGRGRTAADKQVGEQQYQMQKQQEQQQQEQAQAQQQQQEEENGDMQINDEEDGRGGEGGRGGDQGGSRGGEGGSREDRKLQRMRAEAASSSYEFTEEERQRLNGILKQYCGTHNFHNYTVGVSAGGG